MIVIYSLFALLVPVAILVAVVYFIVKFVAKGDAEAKMLTPREFGLELGIFVSLFTSIVALVNIAFAAIDKKFPDILATDNNYYNYTGPMSEDIRIAVAVIVVAFPVYLFLVWMRARTLKNNPVRASIPAMKYQNYITIFFSIVFIIGTLISVVYSYIGGEISSANGLKALLVIILSIALFFYYYISLKRDYSKSSSLSTALIVLSLIAVFGSVFYSVSVLGSPAEVRKMRIDDKRLTDLYSIQQQILTYWQQKKTLPTSTQAFTADGFGGGMIIPKDPVSKEPYAYKIIENSSIVKAKGQDCVAYYPNKYNRYNNNGEVISYDISKISCEMPSQAVFEICANFETSRMYDENGTDQSANVAFDYASPKYNSSTADAIYYGGSYDKSPVWNHPAANTCFKRTIDPTKYPNY